MKIEMSEILEDYSVVYSIQDKEQEKDLEWLTRMGKFYNIEWNEDDYYENYLSKELVDEITIFDKIHYLETEILTLLWDIIIDNNEEIELNNYINI